MHQSFTFIRHGQTNWNLEKRKQGHTDIPLNSTGIKQAHQAKALLSKHHFDHIVTSPLSRASNTAKIINESHNVPIDIDPLLIERSFGELEGKTKEMLAQMNIKAGEESTSPTPKDAEPWDMLKKRCLNVIEKYSQKYPNKKILYVGHGAFFRALYEELISGYYYPKNATPYHFTKQKNTWYLKELE